MNRLISFLQTFGIILVVVGHIGVEGSAVYGFCHDWIYSFHMPLFMFVSGYLTRYGKPSHEAFYGTDLKTFFRKKFNRLLFPYLVISSVVFLPKVIMSRFAMRPVELGFGSFMHNLLYPSDNVIIFFWFLPTLFLIFTIAILLLKYVRSKYVILLPMAIAVIYLLADGPDIPLLNLSGVIRYFLWWGAGFYFAVIQPSVIRWLRLDKWYVALLLPAVTTGLVFIPQNPATFIYSPLSGILFSVSLGLLYIGKDMHFFDHLYGYSYSIYLLSWFVQVPIRIVGIQILEIYWPLVGIVSIVAGIYIPWTIARFVKDKIRSKPIRLLAGI